MTYSSNLNAGLMVAGCVPLITPKIIVYIDSPFVVNNPPPNQAYFFQIHGYSPSGYVTSLQQYVLNVADAPPWSFLTAAVFFKANDGLLPFTGGGNPGSANLQAGWRIEFTLNTDPSTKVVLGMTTMMFDPSNAVRFSDTFLNSQGSSWDASYAAPITGLSIEVPNVSPGRFTSGSGRFLYVPSGGQSFSVVTISGTTYNFPAGCVQNPRQHTAETSNMLYSDPIVNADGSISQQYGLTLTQQPIPTTVTVAAKPH